MEKKNYNLLEASIPPAISANKTDNDNQISLF